MTLNQNDSDFARNAVRVLRDIKTVDLLEVLDVCDTGLTKLLKDTPSREHSIYGTIYTAASLAIVRELERRENPNGDIL